MAKEREQKGIRVAMNRVFFTDDDGTKLTILANMGMTPQGKQFGTLDIRGRLAGEPFVVSATALYDPERQIDGVVARSLDGQASVNGALGSATVKWFKEGVSVTLETDEETFYFATEAIIRFM